MQVMYPTSSRPSRPNGASSGSTGDNNVSVFIAISQPPPLFLPALSSKPDGSRRKLIYRAALSGGQNLNQPTVGIAKFGPPGHFGLLHLHVRLLKFLRNSGIVKRRRGDAEVIYPSLLTFGGLEQADP